MIPSSNPAGMLCSVVFDITNTSKLISPVSVVLVGEPTNFTVPLSVMFGIVVLQVGNPQVPVATETLL